MADDDDDLIGARACARDGSLDRSARAATSLHNGVSVPMLFQLLMSMGWLTHTPNTSIENFSKLFESAWLSSPTYLSCIFLPPTASPHSIGKLVIIVPYGQYRDWF